MKKGQKRTSRRLKRTSRRLKRTSRGLKRKSRRQKRTSRRQKRKSRRLMKGGFGELWVIKQTNKEKYRDLLNIIKDLEPALNNYKTCLKTNPPNKDECLQKYGEIITGYKNSFLESFGEKLDEIGAPDKDLLNIKSYFNNLLEEELKIYNRDKNYIPGPGVLNFTKLDQIIYELEELYNSYNTKYGIVFNIGYKTGTYRKTQSDNISPYAREYNYTDIDDNKHLVYDTGDDYYVTYANLKKEFIKECPYNECVQYIIFSEITKKIEDLHTEYLSTQKKNEEYAAKEYAEKKKNALDWITEKEMADQKIINQEEFENWRKINDPYNIKNMMNI